LLQIYLVEKDYSARYTASSMQTTRILRSRRCEGAFVQVFAASVSTSTCWILAASARASVKEA